MVSETGLGLGLCSCGRKARYLHFKDGVDVGSCSKYKVCPTYDELQTRLETVEKRLVEYQGTINKIDDYFEYRMESKKDQKKVHYLLGDLTNRLAEVDNRKNSGETV